MATVDYASTLKIAARLSKAGETSASLDLLRKALRSRGLAPNDICAAGRLISAEVGRLEGEKRPLRVLLLGQLTTTWLKQALTATAWQHSQLINVSEGAYDQVMQELLTSESASERPDVVVLLPWSAHRLDGGVREALEQVEAEAAFWRQSLSLVRERLGSRIIMVGYDYIVAGAGGFHLGGSNAGNVGRIRDVNAALRRDLPDGAYFVDLEQVSGAMGRETFYSSRRYHWTKQPFSEAGVVRLAEHIWAGIRATTTGPKKVLVLDLDNTLWGGVVGETGAHGIALGDGADGEAYKAFQSYVRDLNSRGVLLAVASKNNAADAREPFTVNREMALNLKHFAAFEASWEPKSVTIARMAKTLNLGLDSFVFFDDNPVERAEVAHALPEVSVVDVPEDPADYVSALHAELWFETTALTDVDRSRAAQYAVERTRRELQEGAGSMEDYLQSLDLRAEVEPIQEGDMGRVVQLLAKTNQFNVTTKRHTHDDLLRIIQTPRSVAISMRAQDKFGDYGLVAVILGIPLDTDPSTILVDTWLMSCRVLTRTFEHFMFGELIKRSQALGYQNLQGKYIPSAKNELVKDLYLTMGCEPVELSSTNIYTLDFGSSSLPVTWVKHTSEDGNIYGG
jgi:FkbH-like protein